MALVSSTSKCGWDDMLGYHQAAPIIIASIRPEAEHELGDVNGNQGRSPCTEEVDVNGSWERKLSTVVFCVFLTATLPGAASGRDWLVNADGTGDVATIQDGIDAAVDFDRIVLAPGRYRDVGNRDIDFLGKAVTVISESGPDVTIIDCEESGRGFLFQNGEGASSILSGITIENGLVSGFGQRGGAILCDGASPTIDGNILRANSGYAGGGAVACDNSANPSITYNLISNNYAGSFYADDGGGIWIDNSSSPIVMDNVISENTGQKGGGIYCTWTTSPQIIGNFISGNGAVNEGGGIWSEAFDVIITANIIHNNSASGGGGMWVNRGPAEISDNTVCENSADGAGGMYITGTTSYNVARTIIAFSSNGAGIVCSETVTISCCLVYGNAGGDDLSGGIDGGNNLFEDPQFCGIVGSGLFTLQSDSPCAAGNNICNQRIGVLGIGCSTTDTEQWTWGGLKKFYE